MAYIQINLKENIDEIYKQYIIVSDENKIKHSQLELLKKQIFEIQNQNDKLGLRMKQIAEKLEISENDVKENSYWRYKLEQAIFRGSDPTKILQAPAKINLIDVATTKALANKYFNDANKAKFVLLPE
jgi:predicted Zn-dependent peptidase